MKKFVFILLIFTTMFCCMSCSSEKYCQNSNHDLDELHVDATCQKTGFDSVYCKNCDYEVISPIPKTSCVITSKETTEDCCTVRVTEVCKYCADEKSSHTYSTHDYVLKTHDDLDIEDYYECTKCHTTKPAGYIKVPVSTNYDVGLNGNTFAKISSDWLSGDKVSFKYRLGSEYMYILDIIFKYTDGTEFNASEMGPGWEFDLFGYRDNKAFYPGNIDLPYEVRTKDVREIYIEFTPIQYHISYTYQDEYGGLKRENNVFRPPNYENWTLPFTIDLFNPIRAQTMTVDRWNSNTFTLALEKDITVVSLGCDPLRGNSSSFDYKIELRYQEDQENED